MFKTRMLLPAVQSPSTPRGNSITGVGFNLNAANRPDQGNNTDMVVNAAATISNTITIEGADGVDGFSLGGTGTLTYTGTMTPYTGMMGLTGSATLSIGTGGSITLNTGGNSVLFGNAGTTLALNGGTFTSTGNNGPQSDYLYNLTMNSGTATMGGSGSSDIMLYTGGTVTLNGGVLSVQAIVAQTAGTNTIFFNGGTLQANSTSGPNVLIPSTVGAIVQAGGAIIDSNSNAIVIAQALTHDPALGATPDGGLTKIGAGMITLTVPSNYTGGTKINAGTLQIGVTNALPATGTVAFAGGTLDSNGYSNNLGPLSISSGNSTLQFGASGDSGNILKFAGASRTSGTLSVTNWDGSLTGNGADEFIVATNPSGVLGSITFVNPAGLPGGNYGATDVAVSGGYEIVPAPEPATIGLLAITGLGLLVRRRRNANTDC